MSNEETKAESIEKIDMLHGSLLGSNIFFNYTFLQQRYNGVCLNSDIKMMLKRIKYIKKISIDTNQSKKLLSYFLGNNGEGLFFKCHGHVCSFSSEPLSFH